MYTIHSLHHSPHSHLTHSLLTNLNFPLTSHLTISPLWFSLSPHHLTLSLKSHSPLSPSYLPTLSPHSPSLFHLTLSHLTPSLPHTLFLSHVTPHSLISLPHLTSLSHLTLPSFFLSPHSPHSLSPHLILLSLSPPTLSPYSPAQFSLSPLSLNLLSSLFLSHSNLYLTSLS